MANSYKIQRKKEFFLNSLKPILKSTLYNDIASTYDKVLKHLSST